MARSLSAEFIREIFSIEMEIIERGGKWCILLTTSAVVSDSSLPHWKCSV
ncbi:MAG: hypothetical protein PHI87_00190 [Candidatus Methanomethylophilus sp.]|nr:hypothetical protein [Methanomethylophilus sp.]MDD4221868.1 hypothetical protein [Methanomethylophilus sp.]MDD4668399.1 hypothetical protein [Methanomethylophilus sp.]